MNVNTHEKLYIRKPLDRPEEMFIFESIYSNFRGCFKTVILLGARVRFKLQNEGAHAHPPTQTAKSRMTPCLKSILKFWQSRETYSL